MSLTRKDAEASIDASDASDASKGLLETLSTLSTLSTRRQSNISKCAQGLPQWQQ
jgi:hypothetical protein